MSKIPLLDKLFLAFTEHAVPADLKVVFVLLLADLILIFVPFPGLSSFKLLLSVPILLLIPGYCCLAALYPRDGDLNLPERIVLSFGFSMPFVILAALVLYLSPWVLQLDSLVLLLFFISVFLILAAHYRRAMVRPQDMYTPQFSEVPAVIRSILAPLGGDRVDRLLSVVLILIVLVAISVTILVIALPKENEHFTDFFILGANRMADDYPYSIIAGQSYPMFIGVGNHEKRDARYLVETWGMNTTFNSTTNTTEIISMDPGDHFSLTLADNETTVIPYALSVQNTADNRVAFLLFNDTVPGPEITGSDRVNASYRDLYLRVSVRQAFYQE